MTTSRGDADDTATALDFGADDEVHVALPNDARAPGEARRAVGATLQRWRLPGLLEAATLVVSELVTNAVRYGLPPIRLVLTRRGRNVLIAVHDEERTEPGQPELPEPAAESGRGLAIVAAFADDSGVESVPNDGKAVYARFEAPADAL